MSSENNSENGQKTNLGAEAGKRLPVLALRNLVLFPGISIPIRVGRNQSLKAIRHARELAHGDAPARIIAVLQSNGDIDHSGFVTANDIHRIGVLCEIGQIKERSKGTDSDGLQLIVKGVERVRLEDLQTHTSIETEPDDSLTAIAVSYPNSDAETDFSATLNEVKEAAKQLVEFLPAGSEQMTGFIEGIEDLDFLTFVSVANLEIPVEEKQKFLEEASLAKRSEMVIAIMARTKDELQVRNEIRDKLHSKLGKTQRDHILREQMKAIREELGDEVSDEDRANEYRGKIEESGMPDEVKKVARDELKRLESLSNQSPETHVIRNYLDLLLALPWTSTEETSIDLKKAKESLEADHFGLEKVKKRILEHLATLKLRGGDRGMIMLLVGPPGVGKTSLGASIAKAIDRKFVRAALGGVRDDAEVRGHRRTYVGAMPGRIIQGIKRAGSMNPVFMLDEIDKLSRGFSGDPAAALLEVLDPEQNDKFHDHYLDVPYDLSKVLFIATANSLEGIPTPLLDRMEIIELSGYTAVEKLHIGRNHLIPKQLEEHGLKPEHVEVSDAVLKTLINGYTREAGVRSLQRQIASLCRSLAVRVAEVEPEKIADKTSPLLPLRPKVEDLDEMLGPVKFDHEETMASAPAGVVTGLAWTPVGGEILFVEATSMPGSGKLTLTGQLGDVMKESAQIALTLIRSRLPQVAERFAFDKRDYHVHVPAGAIPKDGPSAGVAMVTALSSLFIGKPVSPKIAMTGEVTLRGKVTPIGGVKEKIMGAHRAGVTTVIIPRKNERDLRDVPTEVKQAVHIELVDDIADVLRVTLGLELPPLNETTGLWGAFKELANPTIGTSNKRGGGRSTTPHA
ncbi:MAG: endopeptidase La [Bdellovibrionales bacterium]|jgi:ATP-dependent Lon protease|nr:endopeptidase La [Bdellovibrionales bacterium]